MQEKHLDHQKASNIVDLPNLAVDSHQMDGAFEIGFEVPEGESNPYDVPPEILARNRETLNHWVKEWLMQSSLLAPLILEDYKVDPVTGQSYTDRNVDAATCDAERKDVAIIVAPGPSLEKHLKKMRDWKGIIIAPPTALAALVANDIIPHYCVAVDANAAVGEILSEAPYASFGIKLLIPPTCDWRTAKAFDGARYWFKSLILARNGLNHPFNLYMTLFYPWIENWVYQAGCVTNAEFLLTTLLNAHGNHDIKKVFLFGADFGYPENLSRIQSYKYSKKQDGSSFWQIMPRDSVEWRTARVPRAKAANGCPTDVAMLGYKRSLMSIWQMQGCSPFKVEPGNPDSEIRNRPCLYSASEGILFELPRVDGEEVLESQGDAVGLYSDEDIDRTFKDYLRTTGKAEGQIAPDLEVPD
jgi:hypothetical protein